MMKSLSIVAVGLIALANVVSAHVPEDKILGAWQWPTSHLPVLDGDISEWEVLPEELWIEINERDFGGDLGTTKEIDVSDMWFRVAISWHDETDRLYYVIDRFDDLWDRDGGGFGDSGNDDSIEIGVDADHSGDWYFTLDRGLPEEELMRLDGAHAQTYHYRWPAIEPEGWNWFWMSSSTWHDEEPYSCCADSFTLDGSHGTQATLKAEWYTVAWDDFNFQGPEQSVQHDLVELEIIGLGIAVIDNDISPSQEDKRFGRFILGGQNDVFGNASSFTDFVLLPVDEERLPTAVESDTWGSIKSYFME